MSTPVSKQRATRRSSQGAARPIKQPTARRVALDALVSIERHDQFANLALGGFLDESGLDDRDASLVTELVYGTIRRRRSLDFIIGQHVDKRPKPLVRNALRLGVYQLEYTNVAQHAAVSETVSLVPKQYAGFVNAVLRKVSNTKTTWPDVATELSYPSWIIDQLTHDLGRHDALEMARKMNEPPSVHQRDDGYFQDRGSVDVVDALDVKPTGIVVDLCSAPGGKATGIAQRCAAVIANDHSLTRTQLVADNVESLDAVNVSPLVSNGESPAIRAGCADLVLVDAPCSGLGVLRRRPDARWRITQDDVSRLAALQVTLLEAGASLVRPGGVLAYSVCTVTKKETRDVAQRFSQQTPEFAPLGCVPVGWRPVAHGALVLPQDNNTDGMALFQWRRASMAKNA